jgi:hypothetical protein
MVFGVMRIDKILSIPVIRTMDCTACMLVTVLTVLCHLHDVINEIKLGHENCSGKACRNKLVFISESKQSQSSFTILTKMLLDDF